MSFLWGVHSGRWTWTANSANSAAKTSTHWAVWQVTMAASTSTIAAWITMPTVVQRAKPPLTLLHLAGKSEFLWIYYQYQHIMWFSCHVISYHIVSYNVIKYHIISYDIIWYHMISYDIIWYHIISCSIHEDVLNLNRLGLEDIFGEVTRQMASCQALHGSCREFGCGSNNRGCNGVANCNLCCLTQWVQRLPETSVFFRLFQFSTFFL